MLDIGGSLASNNGGSQSVSASGSLGGNSAGYGNIQFLGAYAPLLYHPVPHFYVGLGPNILAELGESSNGTSATSKITSYGVFASIGGWFKMGE